VRVIDPEQIRVIRYQSLCEAPDATLESLTMFCGILFDPVKRAARNEGMATGTDRRYARELPQSDVAWLESFFDVPRPAAMGHIGSLSGIPATPKQIVAC
jgi:hypothetical protein